MENAGYTSNTENFWTKFPARSPTALEHEKNTKQNSRLNQHLHVIGFPLS